MQVFIPLVERLGLSWHSIIQEHFSWPEDLTPHQQRRLDSAKWWITLMGIQTRTPPFAKHARAGELPQKFPQMSPSSSFIG
jgi:hypothetical protein